MEGECEDEQQSYLKFLNDGPHNFLLQSTEEGITDSFPVESIFTEIPQDWQSDGFPILLSGSLVTEDTTEIDESSDIQLFTSENNSNPINNDEDLEDSNTITFFQNVEIGDKNGISSTNNLILSNDVLLQLNPGDEECANDSQSNNHNNIVTYSITYAPNTVDNNESENLTNDDKLINRNSPGEGAIQILNTDGSITTLDKNLFSLIQTQDNRPSSTEIKVEDYYDEIKANKCKVCGFLCESAEDIKTHISIKHLEDLSQNGAISISNGNSSLKVQEMNSILNPNRDKKYTMYVCSECGNGYSIKDDLKQHMITQHNLVYIPDGKGRMKESNLATADDRKVIEPAKEVKSSKIMNYESLLKKQQKAMKKIKCSIKGCPLKFAKDDLRKRHEECHVNEEKKQFMCPVCKMKFSIWRICSMHLWKCHSIDLGLLSCPTCNQFKSLSSSRVINHMSIHNEGKPFICSTCGKDFKQMNQLRNHEVLHKAPDQVPAWCSSRQCEFCDRYFASSKSLKKHIKFVHDKFKPFICSICGHQTARKEMLQVHYRQHTGHKPHQCAYCDYKTGDHNCLRKHQMRHFGMTKYSCPYCSYQAIQATSYKSHMASKHPGKEGTYSCTICTYTTVNVASYLSHVKCHELEKRKQRLNGDEKVEENGEKLSNCVGEDVLTLSNGKDMLNRGEDDETQHCFLTSADPSEETVDTGGITIPAGFDLQLT